MNIKGIIFWIIFVLFIVLAIWYIIGDSPTMEQLLFLFILGALDKQSKLMGKLINRVDILKNRVDILER